MSYSKTFENITSVEVWGPESAYRIEASSRGAGSVEAEFPEKPEDASKERSKLQSTLRRMGSPKDNPWTYRVLSGNMLSLTTATRGPAGTSYSGNPLVIKVPQGMQVISQSELYT